jgi:hypothetical protein
VTEVTSGSDRGILLLALIFPVDPALHMRRGRALFMKPGIPGHDKAKVWLDDEQRRYRLS